MKRIVVAAVVAVGIAAAGGVAIYAASGSVDNSQGGPGGGPGKVVMGGPMGGDGLQHGEFQTGEVTAISKDSVTVRSDDDYEQTYVIDDDTQVADDIAKGDEVTVVATTENDEPVAATVMEMGAMPNGGPNNRRDGSNGGNQPLDGGPSDGDN